MNGNGIIELPDFELVSAEDDVWSGLDSWAFKAAEKLTRLRIRASMHDLHKQIVHKPVLQWFVGRLDFMSDAPLVRLLLS